MEALAGAEIPDPEGVAIRPADAEAVRRDGEAADRTAVPFKRMEAFAGAEIPDPQGAVP